jgi:hypothetical protein
VNSPGSEARGGSRAKSACACASWWLLPLLLALVLAAILVAQSGRIRKHALESTQTAAAQRSDVGPQVHLMIDYGDGRRRSFDGLRWSEGMTVGELLQSHPRVSTMQQGAGASAFLAQINGVANEGAGGRNWMYSVNGRRGDRSFAVYPLRPGDHVLWSFAGEQ